MPRRSEERTFEAGGRSLRVTAVQLDVLDGFEIMARILDILGPATGVLVPALARGAETLAFVEGSELSDSVRQVVANLKDRTARESFMYLALRGCECIVDEDGTLRKVQKLGSEAGMRDAFEADMVAACDVIGFALTVQFGNFFDVVFARWKARIAAAAAKAKAEAEAAKATAAGPSR